LTPRGVFVVVIATATMFEDAHRRRLGDANVEVVDFRDGLVRPGNLVREHT